MKRFLLLVVCVAAAFAAVPAAAYECVDSVDSGYLCVGDSQPFEGCFFSWTGSTTNNWNEVCADSNSDAWTDVYTDGSSQLHSFAVYLHDGYLQGYARVATVCAHAEYDISTSYINQGTC